MFPKYFLYHSFYYLIFALLKNPHWLPTANKLSTSFSTFFGHLLSLLPTSSPNILFPAPTLPREISWILQHPQMLNSSLIPLSLECSLFSLSYIECYSFLSKHFYRSYFDSYQGHFFDFLILSRRV